jgi:hypothetical protein
MATTNIYISESTQGHRKTGNIGQLSKITIDVKFEVPL